MSKKLTKELIVQKIRSDRLGSIKNLNLWGTNLDDVSLIKEMPSLEIISLSVNKITSLKPFSELKNLRELYLRKNMISDLNEIKYLSNCDNLNILWLSENPISDNPNYRNTIISILPQLIKLDDIMITDEERNKAEKNILNSFNNKINYSENDENDNYNNIYNNNYNNNFDDRNYENDKKYYNDDNYNNRNKKNHNRRISQNNMKSKKCNEIYVEYDDQNNFYNIKKNPTYKEKERYDEDIEMIDNKRNKNIKKYQSSKNPRDDYYDNNYISNNNKYSSQTFNNNNNHKDIDFNDFPKKNSQNVLNCILMLLKEINRKDLNVIKREIDRLNNDY